MAMGGTLQASWSWEELPDDCWGIILSNLQEFEPVTRVCKRFLAITNFNSKTLRTPNPNLTFPCTVPPSLYYRFPNLTSLKLQYPHPKLGRFIRQIAASVLPFQSIHLSCQDYFPRKAMRSLGRRKQTTLKSLACTDFRSITKKDVLVIANCFSYLQHLDLSNSRLPTSKVTKTNEAFNVISTQLVSLVSFAFDYAYYDRNPSGLSLFCLSYQCPLLSNLEVSFNRMRPGEIGWFASFTSLSYQCPFLSNLEVSFNRMRPGEIGWFASFTSLTSLGLTNVNISDRGLLCLAQAKLKLAEFRLWCRPTCPSTNSVINGSLMCGFLISLCFLTKLLLYGYKFSEDTIKMDFAASIPKCIESIILTECTHLPTTLFSDLLKNCPKLVLLDFEPNDGVTLVDDLSPLPLHLGLKKLYLNGSNFTDKTVKLICSSFPMLEYLDFWDSVHVTEQGIEEIIVNCRNLNFFEVLDYGLNAKCFKLRR